MLLVLVLEVSSQQLLMLLLDQLSFLLCSDCPSLIVSLPALQQQHFSVAVRPRTSLLTCVSGFLLAAVQGRPWITWKYNEDLVYLSLLN